MKIEDTLAERGARYGVFADHAVICQGIKKAMWQHPGWQKLADDQKQALEVIADKIARMLNGDPDYIDNWHDIIGYAKLVEDRLVGLLQTQQGVPLTVNPFTPQVTPLAQCPSAYGVLQNCHDPL